MSKNPLNYVKHDNAVAVVSINDDPLNRMSLAFIDMLEALHDSEDKTLEQLLAAERRGVHLTMDTPDAQEGIMAFLEKRKPVFNQSVN